MSSLPAEPAIVEAARQRGISQVLHFTRLRQGALGILYSQCVKTRLTLPDDKTLAHVYEPNAMNDQRGRDEPWHDYVNLSITRINPRMFSYSESAHAGEDTSWCIFSFGVEILSQPGGVFTTTNNTYSGVSRQEGLAGFRAIFDSPIHQYLDKDLVRTSDQKPNEPTDPQAEFLHLGDLSLANLLRITTQTEEGHDAVHGMLGVLPVQCEVEHAPETFS